LRALANDEFGLPAQNAAGFTSIAAAVATLRMLGALLASSSDRISPTNVILNSE
jgi:hypothetical protein